MPAPDAEPVEAGVFLPEQQTVQESFEVRNPQGQLETRTRARVIAVQQPSYRSPTLGGEFRAQWMYIIQRGQRVTFWGARVTSLQPDSPLRVLGIRAGDVITRLDGIPIWEGMYRRGNGPWQLPELERHYAQTDVRYIHQGTQVVRSGQIYIDRVNFDDGPEPLAP